MANTDQPTAEKAEPIIRPTAPPPSSNNVVSIEQPAQKKRKQTKAKPPKLVTQPTTTVTAAHPPSRVLVIDNGGDTIKYGWNTDTNPQFIDNVTARLPQQWTVLVGDQLKTTIQNPNQLINVTRSTERGMIVNLGNQIQVWKRMLDLLHVSLPLQTDTAQAFGWKASKQVQKEAIIAPATCAVMIALPPHCPRSILDQIINIWMEDFGFGHVGLALSAMCARKEHAKYSTSVTVDLGWSATHIVPSLGSMLLKEGIRHLPLGGRHLINMWKYYASYRQWNLMDQDWILRDVLEKAGYVSLNFMEDIRKARMLSAGRRPYDREYVLPDYQETFTGSIQLPPLLKRLLDQNGGQGDFEEEEDDDDDDSSVDEKDLCEEDIEDDGGDVVEEPQAQPQQRQQDDDSDALDDDDEEETEDQMRARIMKQRAEEERRRRELEQERQMLNLSVERFTIPECLFRPSDALLPVDMAGLAQAVVQSIEACQKLYQPALYQSIYLVGGISQLEGLKERLLQEVRSLAPNNYNVEVASSAKPLEEAWLGACLFSKQVFSTWSIGRDSWESIGRKGAWNHLVDIGQIV